MTRIFALILLMVALASPLGGGHAPAIEEHAFFPEGGWNRSDRVIQYNAFSLDSAIGLELVQEWAGSSVRHQFSYTLPIFSEAGITGVGDASLNYRYQLFGRGDSAVAVAPRASLVLPTRSAHFGERESGIELAIPMSVALGDRMVSHSRGSAKWTASGGRPELKLAQGLAYTPVPRLSLSLDAEYLFVDGSALRYRPSVQLNLDGPAGLRWSPGVAFPIGGERNGVLLYLAIEHPFSR